MGTLKTAVHTNSTRNKKQLPKSYKKLIKNAKPTQNQHKT